MEAACRYQSTHSAAPTAHPSKVHCTAGTPFPAAAALSPPLVDTRQRLLQERHCKAPASLSAVFGSRVSHSGAECEGTVATSAWPLVIL